MKNSKEDMAWTISSVLDECLHEELVHRDLIVGQVMGKSVSLITDDEITKIIEFYDEIMNEEKYKKSRMAREGQELDKNCTSRVYVLIWWFYEGDSNLVNSFEGVFSTYDKALFRTNELDINGYIEIVTTGDAKLREYNYRGSYGDPSYFEIRECIV